MAIRYSGDTEIRFKWDPESRSFVGRVRDPLLAWSGRVPGTAPKGPDDYDRAAVALFKAASRDARKAKAKFHAVIDGTTLKLRRVFQAPCPCGPA